MKHHACDMLLIIALQKKKKKRFVPAPLLAHVLLWINEEITYFFIKCVLSYDSETNRMRLQKRGERKNHHCQHVHQAGPVQDLLGSSCCALLLAQHFIRQARTRCEAHLKVLIRYHLTMSVIFLYLCHLICLGVISSLCSFICFPSSSCPLQVWYSVILPVPFPFGSLCMGWDESLLFDHTYRESVWAVIWYEPPKPVKGWELQSQLQLFTVIHRIWLHSTTFMPNRVSDSICPSQATAFSW